MHIKVGELLGLIKEEKQILGSIEGLNGFGLSEYLMTIKEAKVNA